MNGEEAKKEGFYYSCENEEPYQSKNE